MRVILFTKNWYPRVGGIERYLDASVYLLRSQFDYSIVHPSFRRGDNFGLREALSLIGAGTLACLKKTDVIHLGDLTMWIFGWLSKFRNPNAKIIAHAYGTEIAFANGRGIRRFLYKLYISPGHKFLAKKAVTICSSQYTAEVCRKLGYYRLEIVHPGMDQRLEKCDCERTELAPNEVLFVGRFAKRKGLHWFAENVLPILDKDIGLAIAGPIQKLSQIESLLEDPRIRYLGQPKDCCLEQMRSESLAVVVPTILTSGSDYEGFGMTAIEAARDGGVVLVGFAEGARDTVVNGVTGFAMKPGQPVSWKVKIEEIMSWSEDHRKSFTERASLEAITRWNWKKTSLGIRDAIMNERN